MEWYSGSGAGGQHRNKHQNSCRLTHIPTKVVVTAQCRSRQNSYNEAFIELHNRLNNKHIYECTAVIAFDRKKQVGSGMRGDKIRTYRYQEDQVKDHRTGNTARIAKVMAGNFDLLW